MLLSRSAATSALTKSNGQLSGLKLSQQNLTKLIPFPFWITKWTGLKLNIQKLSMQDSSPYFRYISISLYCTKTMASGPITSRQIDGESVETLTDVIFLGLKITVDGDCTHEIKRHLLLLLLKRSYDKPRQHVKKQRHYFASKGPYSQGYGFSSSHVWMWQLDYKESQAPKNCCFWTVVLEKTFENPLDCKEINPVHPKGNQPWIFIGRTWHWSWNSNTLATW